jgi:DNA-binding GntR family transcriptional regulator
MDGDAVSSSGAERAYEELRRAIVEQRYAPGERLVEQRVAAELDLSRTPVREALRRLASEGLVLTERNRGAVVRPLDLAEVADLYELRACLESYAARLAAQRITPAELARLRAAVEEFSEATRRSHDDDSVVARELSAANGAVHASIVAAAHHARLATMLDRTVDIPLIFRAFRNFTPSERERSDLFHRLILDAIESGNEQRAGRLMHEHIEQGLDAVVSGMQARQVTPA